MVIRWIVQGRTTSLKDSILTPEREAELAFEPGKTPLDDPALLTALHKVHLEDGIVDEHYVPAIVEYARDDPNGKVLNVVLSPIVTTRESLLQYFTWQTARARDTLSRKNHDYACAGGNDDPFFNFKVTELLHVATAEQGFFTRMADKISRLATFISTGRLLVVGEGSDDALDDLMNYAVLLKAYLATKRWLNVVNPKAQ